MGVVRHLFIAPAEAADMQSLREAEVLLDQGLRGDRYAAAPGQAAPETQVTLIELEQIQAFEQETGYRLAPDAMRRNIVTEGISLNALCGKRFTIAGAEFEGIELCEPCAGIARRTYPELLKYMVHRGGLRAKVIRGGLIRIGDRLTVVGSSRAIS